MNGELRARSARGGGRVRRMLAAILFVAGTLLVADAVLALAWQEPVSALYASNEQRRLGQELEVLESAEAFRPAPAARTAAASERERVRALARALRRRVDRGEALGRIVIPKLGVRYVVVRGADQASLRRAPGQYLFTGLPGEGRTVGIAGHRTTYLAPFRHVDRLRRGDRIVLSMPYGRFEYRVERTRIVSPDAVVVLRSVGHERLVLTSCHPLYSAAQRIVVFARLARTPDV